MVNTCGFIEDAKRESIDAILEVAGAKRRGEVRRLVVAGLHGAALRRASCARRSRRSTRSSGSTSSSGWLRRSAASSEGHLPEQRAALRLYDHTQPRLLSTARLRLPQGRRGVQQPVRVLSHPADAGPLPLAAARPTWWPRRDGSRRRGAGADPDRPGHHPLRRGSRSSVRAGPAACVELLRGHGDPLVAGPLRLPDDPRPGAARAHGGGAAAALLPRHPAPARQAVACCSACGAAATRRGSRTWSSTRAAHGARPGGAHDVHRRLSRGRRGGVRGAASPSWSRVALRPRRCLRLLLAGGEPGCRARRPGPGGAEGSAAEPGSSRCSSHLGRQERGPGGTSVAGPGHRSLAGDGPAAERPTSSARRPRSTDASSSTTASLRPGRWCEVEVTEAHPYDLVGGIVRVLRPSRCNGGPVELPMLG